MVDVEVRGLELDGPVPGYSSSSLKEGRGEVMGELRRERVGEPPGVTGAEMGRMW